MSTAVEPRSEGCCIPIKVKGEKDKFEKFQDCYISGVQYFQYTKLVSVDTPCEQHG